MDGPAVGPVVGAGNGSAVGSPGAAVGGADADVASSVFLSSSVADGDVVGVAGLTTWWALLGLGFLVAALPGLRTVGGGATGPGLVPVLQATGTAELVWSVLVAAPLLVL